MKKNTKTIERNPLYVMMSKFLGLYLVVGFLLRIVLMVLSPNDASYTFGSILRLLSIGVLSDFGTGLLLFIPLLFGSLSFFFWQDCFIRCAAILFLMNTEAVRPSSQRRS